jgi:periplasmic divalent cation tolerance protein
MRAVSSAGLGSPALRQAGCPPLQLQLRRDAGRVLRQRWRMAKVPFRLVFVTAPNLKTARHLAQAALAKRLIACANLVPRIESHYRWQGKLERSAEVLLIMKTTTARLAALERLILSEHPYDTPEFVVLNGAGGTKRYLGWLVDCCR